MATNLRPLGLFPELASTTSAVSGQRLAIADSRTRLTYSELTTLASGFCDALSEAGMQCQDRVGIVLGNCTEFAIAAFGVWMRGAIAVPLNPQLQQAELRKYLQQSDIRGIVTTASNAALVHALREQGVSIEHAWLCSAEVDKWDSIPFSSSGSPRPPAADPGILSDWDRPAVIQFSTGSTGTPKRITRCQKHLLQECASLRAALEITSNDRVLGVTPFFHCYGLVYSVALTLMTGGTLYAISNFVPRELARLVEREAITWMAGVPVMYQALIDSRCRADFSSLRFVLSGGVPLPQETAAAFEAAFGVKIRQAYGTTETGAVSVCDETTEFREPGFVGRPYPGVSLRIVDDLGEPVAAGVEGQVMISSPFAASAYDEAEPSSESWFTRDGFCPGDRGRLSELGELTLCGRHRGFINVSGNKVDPLEVERKLLELPGILEAAVLGVADGAFGQKVKAVLVPSRPMSPTEVREHCSRCLASFKHPKVIEFRKELPRSPLGKVLRKYLVEDAGR